VRKAVERRPIGSCGVGAGIDVSSGLGGMGMAVVGALEEVEEEEEEAKKIPRRQTTPFSSLLSPPKPHSHIQPSSLQNHRARRIHRIHSTAFLGPRKQRPQFEKAKTNNSSAALSPKPIPP
jgi:hypothetical protein